MHLKYGGLLALLCLGIGTAGVASQPASAAGEARSQPRILAPIPVADALNAPALASGPIDLSPDGSWVAYAVRRKLSEIPQMDQELWFTPTGVPRIYGLGADIWISNLSTGDSRNLTGGAGSNWNPVWSPDGSHLAFYSDRDGAARIWLWDRRTERLRRVSDAISRAVYDGDAVQWSRDASTLLVKLLPEDRSLDEAAARLTISDRTTPVEPTFHPGARVQIYRSTGTEAAAPEDDAQQTVNLLEREIVDLAIVDIESGRARRIVSRAPVRWYAISPDEQLVGFTTVTKLTLSPAENRHNLQIVPAAGGAPRVLASDIPKFWWGLSTSWSPDGRHIAFITNDEQGSRCTIVSIAGGEPRHAAGLPRVPDVEQPPAWHPSGDRLYVNGSDSIWTVPIAAEPTRKLSALEKVRIRALVASGGGRRIALGENGRTLTVLTTEPVEQQSVVYELDLETGSTRQLRRDPRRYGSRGSIDVSESGRVVFVSEAAGDPPDIWTSPLAFDNLRQVSHVSSELDRYVQGESRRITYSSYDGQPLSAAVLLPAGYREGTRYPTVVVVYSGVRMTPRLHDYGIRGERFQMLASRGYAVMFPDIPTSGAREMQEIAKMVLPGVDTLVDMGIADPDRLGLMGESHGGYTVMSLIVQSSRFKAAVAGGASANLLSQYGTMRADGSAFQTFWLEKGPHALGGTPWEVLQRYVENSPVLYLDRVRTPLLLVQGERDEAIPPHSTEEIFVGLRRLNRVVEYVKYTGQEHAPERWTLGSQVDYACRAIAWFDRYLKGKDRHDARSLAGCILATIVGAP